MKFVDTWTLYVEYVNALKQPHKAAQSHRNETLGDFTFDSDLR